MAISISFEGITHIFDSYYDVFIRTGAWVDSQFIPDPIQTKIQIAADIQQPKAKDMMFLPEGTNLTDVMVAYSTDAIQVDDAQFNPGKYDIRLVYPDVNDIPTMYRIISQTPWKNNYYKYTLVEIRYDNEIPTEFKCPTLPPPAKQI